MWLHNFIYSPHPILLIQLDFGRVWKSYRYFSLICFLWCFTFSSIMLSMQWSPSIYLSELRKKWFLVRWHCIFKMFHVRLQAQNPQTGWKPPLSYSRWLGSFLEVSSRFVLRHLLKLIRNKVTEVNKNLFILALLIMMKIGFNLIEQQWKNINIIKTHILTEYGNRHLNSGTIWLHLKIKKTSQYISKQKRQETIYNTTKIWFLKTGTI